MKRTNNEQVGGPCTASPMLKRRSSSMFTIATVNEDDEDEEDAVLVAETLPPGGGRPDGACTDIDGDPSHSRTGLVFEYGLGHYDRHNKLHKERPLRITAILKALQQSHLYARCTVLDTKDVLSLVEEEDFLRVHSPAYMKRLSKLSTCACNDTLHHEAAQYKSIYLTQDSFHQATLAAASLCSLVSHVVDGRLDNGFAVIRPPGHHAEPSNAGGYCLINNVAVAASFARHKLGVNRILIVDWDIHHGNGTQSIFLDNPNVLYFSIHRGGSNFYPHGIDRGPSCVGVGRAKGFNVNVSWTSKGMGDAEYMAVCRQLLLPIAKEFQPDLILVSAGFDGAQGDMGECHVTPECFAQMTRCLQRHGKVVCALEGGYVRSVLAKCVEKVVQALLEGEEEHEDEESVPSTVPLPDMDSVAAQDLQATIRAHRPYWKCLVVKGNRLDCP